MCSINIGRGLLGEGGRRRGAKGIRQRGREKGGGEGRTVVHFMYDVETVKAKKKARGRAARTVVQFSVARK